MTDKKELMMAAYLVVDCKVTDASRYEDYKRLAQAAVARHGGRYLGRPSCSRAVGSPPGS
jgi:uncharacterized protein (DUF1330 family)